MAEAVVNTEHDVNDKSPECPVCLQPYVHPAQLPCGHIFCYLCVKGFANQSKRCAMCRQEIPRDFFEQPHLLQPVETVEENFDGGYQWFYEGRNGWWQYDERTSKELENSYKNGDKSVELLIAGFLYIVDFENMLQLRRNDPSRRRQIKRDVSTISKKGVAGIRSHNPQLQQPEIRPSSPTEGRSDNDHLTPTTPSNTPQSPTSGRESPSRNEQDLQATVELISNLRIDSVYCNRSDANNSDNGNSDVE
ncbi:unnamed protein product [Ceutorhynchus assimilis]|uniref:E3 ubiquitin-protein ligase n=1 Tax=Ceutorhynchus assimilis TaxID=467358 RepID=A0A9P0DI97_9CUCU|nr:unnamed protein product [Ceutorhynchus assimilis]